MWPHQNGRAILRGLQDIMATGREPGCRRQKLYPPARKQRQARQRYRAERCRCESAAAVATGCGAEGQTSAEINAATFSNRSGCRGARIITAVGNFCWTALNAASTGSSSPSAVLPQTITGESLSMAARRPFTRRRLRIRSDIEFQIAADSHAFRGRADFAQSLGVCCRLRQKQIDF